MSERPDLGPRPHLGYTQSQIDRAAKRRLDGLWMAARATEPRALSYLIGRDLIVLKKNGSGFDPAFTLQEAQSLAPIIETVFLGLVDGAARFGLGIDQAKDELHKASKELYDIDYRSIAVQGLAVDNNNAAAL